MLMGLVRPGLLRSAALELLDVRRWKKTQRTAPSEQELARQPSFDPTTGEPVSRSDRYDFLWNALGKQLLKYSIQSKGAKGTTYRLHLIYKLFLL